MDYQLKESTQKEIEEKNLEFEKANIKDIDEILNLFKERVEWFRQNNIDQWRRYFEFQSRETFAYVIENSFYFILKQDEKIIAGFEIATKGDKYWEDNAKDAYYVNKVVTKVDYKGLGNTIFKICKEIASNNNKNALRLNCNSANNQLNSIYQKHGFNLVKCGIADWYTYSLREWRIDNK